VPPHLMTRGFAPLFAALALQSVMRSVMRAALRAMGRIAFWLGVAVAVAGGPARAADTGNGSKNFHTPSSVPNYFSNEAGPMLGGPAESQRGQLYPSQTVGDPRPAEAVAAPPAHPPIRRIVTAHGRVHLASRTPVDRRHVATRVGPHRRLAGGHASAGAHARHAATRATHTGVAHKRARG